MLRSILGLIVCALRLKKWRIRGIGYFL